MASSGSRLDQVNKVIGSGSGSRFSQTLAGKLFGDDSLDDIRQLSPLDMAGLATNAYDFIKARKPGRASVRVYNPDLPVTVIETINDDMPFLVDSIIGLLSSRGHEIQLVLHPILHVIRDAKGNLERIDDAADPTGGTARESLIHIHVAPLSGKKALDGLASDINSVLKDVRTTVLDWRAMQVRIKDAITGYQTNPPPIPVDDLTEAMAFLQWLLDNHFTFLGLREYAFDGSPQTAELKPVEGTGLGVLRDDEMHVMRRGTTTMSMTPEIRSFLLQPAPVFITKSDAVSTVHRRAFMDYVGIKQYDDDGNLAGEIRAIGLFTSTAYTRSPREIPLIRRKISNVITLSGYSADSHSGKGLLNVLETFPRDELFQIDTSTLARITQGVYRLEERPRTRLFVRHDRFHRFVSAFVYISRDRFSSEVRQQVGQRLAEAYGGEVTSFSPSFGEGALVRVHFIITRRDGKAEKEETGSLEAEIAEIVRTWDDRLFEALDATHSEEDSRRLKRKYRDSFSRGYKDVFNPQDSLHDIRQIEGLPSDRDLGVHFYQAGDATGDTLRLKLYHRDEAVPLSGLMPIIENLGLKAIEEHTFTLTRFGSVNTRDFFIHDFLLTTGDGGQADIGARGNDLAECFYAVWTGQAENDRYNSLVLNASFDWRDAALLRACGSYLRQGGMTHSTEYMASTLTKHAGIARTLAKMFHVRFQPGKASLEKRGKEVAALASEIDETLQSVSSLDEDRIVRRFTNLITNINRTNFYQRREDGSLKPTIAFKINSRKIDELPEPRPFAEISVYAPDVEGVHLRGGMIARGGLRWSDRREDFRTEVLGLAKAQNVKNAVIVPVGAKGGFVPKALPDGSREEVFAEGTRTYKLFINSLLDVTDNLDGDTIIPPEDVVRYDGDDPYLVVAADKGTATFSDTANGISQERGFWMDDAFASGGSAGYDHKAMGITARGGWEAVKRHFREMNVNIQTTPFTVVGVGDMSGDVFGNGMLLSEQIKLIAAFDHRDIFIDPDPDPATSFAERKRLFETPRTTWKDYSEKLISKGGGVFSRQLKSIKLTPEIKAMTGLKEDSVTPNALLKALLKAPSDLLWFGGIGTYLRASTETDTDAGDRANDPIRITAKEAGAKVIGEGANLGLTQRARIEFAMNGGRINTDAVDNSAGVNSSDVEVNIKIAFSAAEAAGKLKRTKRNKLLADMTDEVAELVLRNNYLQTLSISMAERRGQKEVQYLIRTMRDLESRGLLDRPLEFLPDDVELAERAEKALALTRPELSVLMAYAKMVLFDDLLKSRVPDNTYFTDQLIGYFPTKMTKPYKAEIENHKLRREIIATLVANEMINRGGPSFVSRLTEETGHGPGDIARAYTIASDSFGFSELNDMIDALDNRIDGEKQLELYLELQRILRRTTIWFLRNMPETDDLSGLVSQYKTAFNELSGEIEDLLPGENAGRISKRARALVAEKVPEELAGRLASLRYMQRLPDIALVASQTGSKVVPTARIYFTAGIEFGFDRLMALASQIEPASFFERMAVNRTIDGIFQTHRSIVAGILSGKHGKDDPWKTWSEKNATQLERIRKSIDELLRDKDFGLAKLALAAGHLSELATATA